jgi:hypothetical protein
MLPHRARRPGQVALVCHTEQHSPSGIKIGSVAKPACIIASAGATGLQGAASAAGHRAEAQTQGIQLDEALGIDLIIGALVVFESYHLH